MSKKNTIQKKKKKEKVPNLCSEYVILLCKFQWLSLACSNVSKMVFFRAQGDFEVFLDKSVL